MIIAVDTGGTKTLVSGFIDETTIAKTIRFETPKSETEYITQLVQTIESVSGEIAIEVIVVAMPGIVKDGVAIWCNNLKWKNFDVYTALDAYFPDTPIAIENDANLGGLGEVRRMTPMPASALYTTISTGIGTGYIVNGTIDPGLRLSEGGRTPIEFEGMMREWETFASGSAITHTFGKYARDISSKKDWLKIADRISRGFLAIIPVIRPDTIIIGGSIGTYFARYEGALITLLRQHLPAHIDIPTFVQAKTPEEAVIYGCYYFGSDYIARP